MENETSREVTVVTGVVGDDIHVVGLRILEYALRKAGTRVVSLGPLVSQREFINAAIETDADALFVSSLNGHAEISLTGFRDACEEAGIGGILIYAGGQLTIRQPAWSDVEHLFIDTLRMDRIYAPGVNPDEAIQDLLSDVHARRSCCQDAANAESDGPTREPAQKGRSK
jgi:methylaspartate mutase sigma subunit